MATTVYEGEIGVAGTHLYTWAELLKAWLALTIG